MENEICGSSTVTDLMLMNLKHNNTHISSI